MMDINLLNFNCALLELRVRLVLYSPNLQVFGGSYGIESVFNVGNSSLSF